MTDVGNILWNIGLTKFAEDMAARLIANRDKTIANIRMGDRFAIRMMLSITPFNVKQSKKRGEITNHTVDFCVKAIGIMEME